MLILGTIATGIRFIQGGGVDPEPSGHRLVLTSRQLRPAQVSAWFPWHVSVMGGGGSTGNRLAEECALGISGRIMRATITAAEHTSATPMDYDIMVDGEVVAHATIPGNAADVRVDFDIPSEGIVVTPTSKVVYRQVAGYTGTNIVVRHFELEVEYDGNASWPVYYAVGTVTKTTATKEYAPIVGGHWAAASNGWMLESRRGRAGGFIREVMAGTLKDIVIYVTSNTANAPMVVEVFHNDVAVISYTIPLGFTGAISIPGTVVTETGDTLYYGASIPGRTTGGVGVSNIHAVFESDTTSWQLYSGSGNAFQANNTTNHYTMTGVGPNAFAASELACNRVQLPPTIMTEMRGGAQTRSTANVAVGVVRKNGADTDMTISVTTGENYTNIQRNLTAEVEFEAGDFVTYYQSPRFANVVGADGRHAFTYVMTPVPTAP